MSSKAIKVSKKTYEKLKMISEEKKISIKEVVDQIVDSENDIEKYKGSWELGDKEAKKIKDEREKLWDRWDL